MTHLPISINAASFDRAVHGPDPEGLETLRDAGDLALIIKPHATKEDYPAVVLTFRVELPNGRLARVQTVTTARCLIGAGRFLENAFPPS